MKKSVHISNRNLFILIALLLITTVSAFVQKLHPQEQVIGKLIWEGNERYDDARLATLLPINSGDLYDKKQISSLFDYSPKKNATNDITSLYMDQGHLFFNITLDESVNGNAVDLTFHIFEGPITTVDQIRIEGNQKIESDEILAMIEMVKGDLFNRSKLIASQRNIANSGFFNPEQVNVVPIPDPEHSSVDIVFEVEEL